MHTYYQTYKKALKPPVKAQGKMRPKPQRDNRSLPHRNEPNPAAKQS